MMRDALRLYFRYVGVSIRAQLSFPGGLALQIIGQILITAIEIVGVVALFGRFGTLRGWTLPQVAFLYGLADVTFALADALGRGFSTFGTMVRTGDFDRILLRPRSTVLQIFGQELTLRRVGRLAQGAAVLVWAAAHAEVGWTAGHLAVLLGAIAGGVGVFTGLFVLQATSAFWTVESLEVWNSVTYGGNYASQYPMSIYRSWFRAFFTYVIPLSLVTFVPGAAILGLAESSAALAPLAGAAFFLVSLAVWKVGVRHYTSTGS